MCNSNHNDTNNPHLEIISINELLNKIEKGKIIIPDYQRPYKWQKEHVNQLINDIISFKDKSEYRLGNLILYKDKNKHDKYEIVDGQQRIITIILVNRALEEKDNHKAKNYNKIYNLRVKGNISQKNIHENYKVIKSRINELNNEKICDFLYNKCTFLKITINNLSEAFQFFDCENARGKELEPHDLLKAYHLREMRDVSEEEKKKIVESWEELGTEKLSNLFGKYLYRIRNWCRGNSARYFTKKDIHIFKGVTIDNDKWKKYPYLSGKRLITTYYSRYNNSIDRQIDGHKLPYPFQLDDIVINGKYFFEMVEHYANIVDNIATSDFEKIAKFIDLAQGDDEYKILEKINIYDERYRIGDQYVRNLFDCLLIYYYDKFGRYDINKAIIKFFVWTYNIRFSQFSIPMATVDNYATGKNNNGFSFFKLIKDSIYHDDVVRYDMDELVNIDDHKKENELKIDAKLRKCFKDILSEKSEVI